MPESKYALRLRALGLHKVDNYQVPKDQRPPPPARPQFYYMTGGGVATAVHDECGDRWVVIGKHIDLAAKIPEFEKIKDVVINVTEIETKWGTDE